METLRPYAGKTKTNPFRLHGVQPKVSSPAGRESQPFQTLASVHHHEDALNAGDAIDPKAMGDTHSGSQT